MGRLIQPMRCKGGLCLSRGEELTTDKQLEERCVDLARAWQECRRAEVGTQVCRKGGKVGSVLQ